MVTAPKQQLYVEENIFSRGFSYERVGEKLGVSRTTVYRWAKEQHRLDPDKLASLAAAIGCKPTDFYRMPDKRPSIDAILADADDEAFGATYDLAQRLAKRGS